MKKNEFMKRISTLSILGVMGVTALSGSFTASAAKNYIGVERAKAIALRDAGVSGVTFVKAKLDYDDGVRVYDVEFYKDNVEYDYEIDAVTGQIREKDLDIENYTIPKKKEKNKKNKKNKNNNSNYTYDIGVERAKEIALKDAGVSGVTFVKAKLDYDDGVRVYDIEFYKDNVEYDYEIDAATGQIREKDWDIENYTIPQINNNNNNNPNHTADIGVEKAKEIALKDAGVSGVTFVKAKLDYDDGVRVYDIEFYKDNVEYDYEIDAATGQIREKDWDIENYTIPQINNNPNHTADIGVEKAKEIALKDAGVSGVFFKKVKIDYEDGVRVYDVEFYKGNVEYEYEIDAATGQIREKDWDIENYTIPQINNNNNNNPNYTYDIGVERAKEIALKDAGVSGVFFKKVKIDYEDGVRVYDVEFYKGNVEYEYEIDAATGEIRERSVEIDD